MVRQGNGNDPRISVIVTTYQNHKALAYVAQALRSQTVADFETIVVNDGGCLEETKAAFGEANENVRFLYLEPPTDLFRLAAARNLGVRHARGERYLMLDEDCVPAANMVEKHLDYIGTTDVVCSNRWAILDSIWSGVKDASDLPNLAICPRIKIWSGPHKNFEVMFRDIKDESGKILHYQFEDIWGAGTSYPTQVVKSIGGYWEKFVGWGGEDSELAKRLMSLGLRGLLRPDISYYHLNHETRKRDGWEERVSVLFDESDRMLTPVRNGGPLV